MNNNDCEKMTLETLKSEVVKAGFTLSCGAWEDETMMYAASVESVVGCFGHPSFEATFDKRSGWVRIGKQPGFKLAI